MDLLQKGFLTLSAVMVLFWLVFAFLGPKPTYASAIVVMRYGRALRFIAILFALAPPIGLAALMWYLPWRNSQMIAIAGGTFFVIGILCGLLLVEVSRVQIIVTEESITRMSPWTGTCTMKWSEIENVRYADVNRWFVITGGIGVIRVSRYLGGLRELAETLRRKVSAERWADAAGELPQ